MTFVFSIDAVTNAMMSLLLCRYHVLGILQPRYINFEYNKTKLILIVTRFAVNHSPRFILPVNKHEFAIKGENKVAILT